MERQCTTSVVVYTPLPRTCTVCLGVWVFRCPRRLRLLACSLIPSVEPRRGGVCERTLRSRQAERGQFVWPQDPERASRSDSRPILRLRVTPSSTASATHGWARWAHPSSVSSSRTSWRRHGKCGTNTPLPLCVPHLPKARGPHKVGSR